MPRITMFVQNGIYNDNRVLKEASALADAGYDVSLVGLHAPGHPDFETIGKVRLIRLFARGVTRTRLKAGSDQRQEKIINRLPGAIIRRAAGLANRVAFRALNRLTWHLEPLTYMYDFDRAVASHESELRADIWYAHDLNTLTTALRLKSKYGGKVVYDAHEYWLDCNNVYSPFAKFVWAQMERRLIGKADQIITVSPSIATKLGRDYGVAEPAVVLNTPPLSPLKPVIPLRERFNLGNKFILVYVGRVTHQRGYELLVDAVAALPDVALVCFGHGNADYVKELQTRIDKAGIAGRFVFAGSVPPSEIQDHIASAQAGIITVQRGAISYDFALPSKLFEYVFAGLPVVASDLIEIRKLVDEYHLGVTIDERDAKSIAAGIEQLRAEYEEFSGPAWKENQARFAATYRWEVHQKVLVDLMAKLTQTQAVGA